MLLSRAITGLYKSALILGLGLVTPSCASDDMQAVPATAGGTVLLAVAPEGSQHKTGSPLDGESPSGHFLAAIFANHQQDLSAAAEFMMDALASDPNNQELLEEAFTLAIADGRFPQAADLARRFIEQDSGHELANLTLAVQAVEGGNLEAAEAALRRIPDSGLNTIVVPLMSGWMALAAGDPEAGLARLKPLQDASGFRVLHDLHAALMNDIVGRGAEAEAAFGSALEQVAEPSLRLTWLAGNFFARHGQPQRAARIYDEFRRAKPDAALMAVALDSLETAEQPAAEVATAREGMAETLFNVASLLAQERADVLALAHTHLALRLRPDFPVALILLGELMQGQDRSGDAIAAYRSVPENSSFHWLARLRIADELERLERTAEAIAVLEDLAERRPGRYEPLFQLGNLLRAEERFSEAVEAYDRAVARLGEPRPSNWMLFYFRGIALERSKQWDRAEGNLLKALELEPEQPHVMNYLAYSWVEQKVHLERAKKMLHRAVELRPRDGFIVDSLGWVFYRLGDYTEAVTYLEQAVELRPQDPVLNDHLGDAYWKVGRRMEARFQWRRALSLKPEADLVPTIKAKIDRGLAAKPGNI